MLPVFFCDFCIDMKRRKQNQSYTWIMFHNNFVNSIIHDTNSQYVTLTIMSLKSD